MNIDNFDPESEVEKFSFHCLLKVLIAVGDVNAGISFINSEVFCFLCFFEAEKVFSNLFSRIVEWPMPII